MSTSENSSVTRPPDLRLTAPAFETAPGANSPEIQSRRRSIDVDQSRSSSEAPQDGGKHVRLELEELPKTSVSDPYLGSFARATFSRSALDVSAGAGTPGSVPSTPRASAGQVQLERLLSQVDVGLDTYGVEEVRDGFFDAFFFHAHGLDRTQLRDEALRTLPRSLRKDDHLRERFSFLRQCRAFVRESKQVLTTRAGVKLLKSFLGFFIAYVVCLVPTAGDWLGRYSYIMPISAVFNHPGRTVGAEIDGFLGTIVGTILGLGWGSLALYVSTATDPARAGYGGVLALFLIVFTACMAWLRCVYMKFYQAVICAGIAVAYTCLADTSEAIGWGKLMNYGLPWIFGQCVALLVCLVVIPDAGARPIAVSLHNALESINAAMILPRLDLDPSSTRGALGWHFVNLSLTARDFTIDISASHFRPEDIRQLRNLIQGVIRSVLTIKTSTTLFNCGLNERSSTSTVDHPEVADLHGASKPSQKIPNDGEVLSHVASVLAPPTRSMIDVSREAVLTCNATLMDIAGYRKYLGPPSNSVSDLRPALHNLKKAMSDFDRADASLIDHSRLPHLYHDHPELVQVFLFVHPIRQTADYIEALLLRVLEMQLAKRPWRPYMPSYPFWKGLLRTNAAVRHDRGGLTANFFFRSKSELEKTMRDLHSTMYKPTPRENPPSKKDHGLEKMPSFRRSEKLTDAVGDVRTTTRYRIWKVLHKLQGFEARFAFKVTLCVALLAIPAWLPQSRGWWNENETWWIVVTVWIMMHPRVGGNAQDLFTRAFCGVLGSFWGGVTYAAGNGNPYVMGVLCAVFMIPMIFRYTQSSHPRSGIVGCVSFIVVSLSAYNSDGHPSPSRIAWTRGTAIVVGIVAAVVVNWLFFGFIARHELRKSLSALMLHTAILYRGVVARYIYYEDDEAPTKKDIERSEMLEGFVRIRQLMELTRHEIRLRAPFDPTPYSGLITTIERLFDHLIEVRQSSLYFQPYMHAQSRTTATALLIPRRDAVAAILMTLYVLAGALRSARPVPRYLPSAAAARKKLLERMASIEAEAAHSTAADAEGHDGADASASKMGTGEGKTRRWADVYQYAYSSALTSIVEQLDQLTAYTKVICGEVGFEGLISDDSDYSDDDDEGSADEGGGNEGDDNQDGDDEDGRKRRV
ncbi:MAG: hypothetical protein M1833_007402 [Piccolia ochrophora]|nr:MAG: hypothetical protein M1833_007402 [Piccolia ochrophora]